jgi:Phasin protein
MEADKNPFEAVRAMMIDNLEKSRSATQSYLDLFERAMRNFPNANEDQVGAFKAYIERQVAANHAYVDKLLRAKDFQDAFRIQADYLQSQLKAAAEDATQLGAKLAGSFNRSTS